MDEQRTVTLDGIEWNVYDGPLCLPGEVFLVNKAWAEGLLRPDGGHWLFREDNDYPWRHEALDLMTFDLPGNR